jgi:ATP-binding cassette subfamily F protein uup
MKAKMISASQLLERFDAKTIRFCGSFKRWGIETLYLCTVLIQNFLILDEPTNDLDIVT